MSAQEVGGAPARDSLAPLLPSDGVLRVASPDGLVQTVRISPAAPHQGERIHIEVTLRNEGSDTTQVEVYICTFPLAGLVLDGPPRITCAGLSVHEPFPPGAVHRQAETWILRSAPGTHEVTTGLLRTPARPVRFRLVVRPAPASRRRSLERPPN